MKRATLSLGVTALAAACSATGCGQDFGHVGQDKHIAVHITAGDRGAYDQPHRLGLSVNTPTSYTVHLEARNPDESVNTDFNGYVRLTVKPGTVLDNGVRNVQLHGGVADGIVVPIVGSFGDTHIWAEDLGYEPADPARNPPPQCANGVDDNHNEEIDYPAEPGCYAPNDDTEDLGSYAAGASETIYYQLPRVQFVRGWDPAENGNGNRTLYPNQQVQIDTGWRGGEDYAFSTVVVNVAADGFFAQDIQDDQRPQTGYGGVFAYTYSSPPFLRVCDRLQQFAGQAADFYGFTELNYPTWQIEPWDPSKRPCLVPEPVVLLPQRPKPPSGPGGSDLSDDNRLWQLESTLVRVIAAGDVSLHVAGHFGPDFVPFVNGAYVPGPNASNCDFNRNGKVDYSDPMEGPCGTTCNGTSSAAPTDMECSEYSAYASQGDFELMVVEPSADSPLQRIQVNASAAALFNPVTQRGLPIKATTGTLRYFSGGSQFTIQSR